ncbi:lysosomal cystine transporter [Linnemannia elongata AG-77]|uniref:Lysosomal cystine transporter n=1 Tax=Linnemannia elongata AG-77 TaxID=1314771 RepID=A0A197JVY5_9FUNG|nr:lysosomal cystine transporter [Linnemannia elongata AG-77]
MDAAAQQGFGEILSHVIGWAYFIAWSASFYPQAILNWRRKSVQGLSMDFIYLNVLGFLCYSIFNLSFYYSPEVQEEYRKRNDGQDNLVRANDVFFAVHALILSSFTLFQTLIYKRDEGQKVSSPTKLLILISTFGASIVFGAAYAGTSQWIDVLYYLSYIKLGISFIKYCPQVYLNYASQSTVGWSIHNILLDFTGGALSIGQLVLDAYISGDWSGISGDPVKFGLGFLSIAFDLIFMTQHFILYRNRKDFYAPLSMVENNGEAHESKKLLLSPGHRTYSSIQREDARVSRPASMKDLELGFDDSQHSTRH